MGTKKWQDYKQFPKELEWDTNRDSKLEGATVINMFQLTFTCSKYGNTSAMSEISSKTLPLTSFWCLYC